MFKLIPKWLSRRMYNIQSDFFLLTCANSLMSLSKIYLGEMVLTVRFNLDFYLNYYLFTARIIQPLVVLPFSIV